MKAMEKLESVRDKFQETSDGEMTGGGGEKRGDEARRGAKRLTGFSFSGLHRVRGSAKESQEGQAGLRADQEGAFRSLQRLLRVRGHQHRRDLQGPVPQQQRTGVLLCSKRRHLLALPVR